MKQVSGQLKLDLAQYNELKAFAQFASDLDRRTRATLERGQRMTELLKQPANSPVPFAQQVIAIYAGTRGYLDDVPVEKVGEFERGLLRFLASEHPEIEKDIAEKQALSDETDKALSAAIEEFKKGFAG
jgi:F-type H+-transporting ATPase subunit alpha